MLLDKYVVYHSEVICCWISMWFITAKSYVVG